MKTKTLITQRLNKIAKGLSVQVANAIKEDLQITLDGIVTKHKEQAAAEVMAVLESHLTESRIAQFFAHVVTQKIMEERRQGASHFRRHRKFIFYESDLTSSK